MKIKTNFKIEIDGGNGSAEYCYLKGDDKWVNIGFTRVGNSPKEISIEMNQVKELHSVLETYLVSVEKYKDINK